MTKPPFGCLAAWLLAALLLGGCASDGAPLPPAPLRPNGEALWRIIHEQCVPDQRSHNDPAPCAEVSMAGGEARGFVVLKDRAGVAQYLLMPTAKITGIEDPAVLAPGAANYFAQAWDERGYVERKLGRPLGRAQLSIAVNSIYGRSQDQLHLHIDCLDRSVRAALLAADIPRTGRWTERGIRLKGHAYRARWLGAGELAAANPFQLLAQSMPGARGAMGAWTLALVGAAAPDGAQGFYLLADRADPAAGDPGSAEDLQNHDCRP